MQNILLFNVRHLNEAQGLLLLTWFNFNLSMDK